MQVSNPATPDRESFRHALTAERNALRADDAASAAERKPVVLDQQSVGRLSRMDAMQVQAMAVATGERRQARIRRIEAALKRIETGEFGLCVTCGEDIVPKRLALDPAVATCITCAKGGAQ